MKLVRIAPLPLLRLRRRRRWPRTDPNGASGATICSPRRGRERFGSSISSGVVATGARDGKRPLADPAVQELLAQYLRCASTRTPIRLSSRYGDWGWPATIRVRALTAPDCQDQGIYRTERLAGAAQGRDRHPRPDLRGEA